VRKAIPRGGDATVDHLGALGHNPDLAFVLMEIDGMRAIGSQAYVYAAGTPMYPSILALIDALSPADRIGVGSFGFEIAVGANLTRRRR
jgi:hypothetical protein